VDDLLSEKEQIDQLRAWWSEYGRYVIAGVIIAVGLLIGFNRYQSSKLDAQLAASALYETLAGHVTDGDIENAAGVSEELASNYASTTYAAQSKLAMARLYMDENRDQDAADSLSELLALPGNSELKEIGKLRLARILLYQDKPQEVVDLLANPALSAFDALANELLGDAHLALGQVDAAGEAYRKALADTSPTPTINRGLVQMKLADLPALEASPEAAEPPADEGIQGAAPEDGAAGDIEAPTEAVADADVGDDDEAGDTE
jgi:predicted negative regulator of RcsB-dependent stress response